MMDGFGCSQITSASITSYPSHNACLWLVSLSLKSTVGEPVQCRRPTVQCDIVIDRDQPKRTD